MISKKIIDTIAVQLLISKRINKLVSDLVAKGKLKMKTLEFRSYLNVLFHLTLNLKILCLLKLSIGYLYPSTY